MLGNILAVGLMSMGMGLSGVKDEPKMYVQNESTYSITYENEEDWSSRSSDIYAWLLQNYNTNNLAVTGQIVYTYNENQNTYSIDYLNADTGYILVHNSTTQSSILYRTDTSSWTNISNTETYTFNSLTITSQTYYEAMAEAEPSMGNDIVGTIASGLGIIGALATTFLTGFGNLFYSSGALTPFAIFALVMLGIAVSFAVVKLVLNLIRSNTGA